MWSAPEEPPDNMEVAGSSKSGGDPSSNVKEICEDNKSQLETFKDIMLKTKKDLKKKEEELQGYASKLSEIKSRSKRSRRSRDAGSSSVETTPKSKDDVDMGGSKEDAVDDISQAKTPKAKSSLLQRKLAENRKIFEQRSKEMTESKRAVEEKVEAIRQQMDQTDLSIAESQKDPSTVTPVKPVLITSQIVAPLDVQVALFPDTDNKVVELNNRILELEALVIDLQDNLKEKDSVIESKTRAVTLMSADLSKKGKSTLDTLEDTKDEMRTMQENFVLIESSLRVKNENLLEQLQERNERVTHLEETVNRYEQEMEEKRLAENASASLSRTTIDTLADTKNEMRSMQENFVLIETSLREKNDNLLQQLQEKETKLAEAIEKIYKLESGAGITSAPEISDLQYKIERLERSNLALQDEKFELQKSIGELQEKIVSRESSNGNGLIIEKDNRIAELETLIDELKNSNQLLEEESKAELQKQIDELVTRNDEFRSKIDDLERLNNDLETEKNELRAKIPDHSESAKEDAVVQKLKKELDDLNKSMIKLKAQHKSKLRNLQKQLENFKMVSDTNAELVKLGNQVALLEEEKGNLQLSLVDFDELKASAGDWQDRIADLESRVSAQANDIQAHVEAIAILENQKLDLMQDLHAAKQEISALEAENAESENLRVSAEMKVVDMEEQLESLHKMHNENATLTPSDEKTSEDLLGKIEALTQENHELVQKIAKLEEKPSSDAGSTESFETIHEDRNELTKKIEALSVRNAELEEKLLKLEEATRSNVGSTESFETINDTDRSELVKKIDLLSRENSDLVTRLNKFEEKGSSDTGSTESFEKIPEHVDSSSRIDILTRENNELVIKLTKLEEKMDNLSARQIGETSELIRSEDSAVKDGRLENLVRENNDLVIELTKVQERLSRVSEEKDELQKFVDANQHQETNIEQLNSQMNLLSVENEDLLVKLREKSAELSENVEKLTETERTCHRDREEENIAKSTTEAKIAALETEIDNCRKLIAEQTELIDEMKTKLTDKETELEERIKRIGEYEASGVSAENLQRELTESFGIIEEWKFKCETMERKMEILESGKIAIEEGLKILQDENKILAEETKKKDAIAVALKEELDRTIANFSNRLDENQVAALKQEEEISKLQELLQNKDKELHEKYTLLQNEMINIDSLQEELNERRIQLQENATIILTLNEEIQSLKAAKIVNEEQLSAANAEIGLLREELSTKAAKEANNEQLLDEIKRTMNDYLKENENLRTMIENSNAQIEHLRVELAAKNDQVALLQKEKLHSEDQINDLTIAKNALEMKIQSLHNSFDENTKFAENLKVELGDAYRMMELLKNKHTEDVEMLNRRLEDLIEDLNAKTSECETLQAELTEKLKIVQELESRKLELEVCREQLIEKEILVGQNVTESVKIDLERRVNELEEKLLESENNTQTQLQKRKILAANLKKKSAQYEELEAKAAELEAKVSELEEKATKYESKASAFEARAMELEPIAAGLEAELGDLKTKVTELETYVAHLEPKASTFEAKATELGIQAAEFEAEARALGIKLAEFEAKATNSEAKVTELEIQNAVLEKKASKYEFEVSEFQSKATSLEAQIQELVSQITRLENEATELKVKAAEFETKAAENEAKAAEYEEKWISEKDEKDALNLKIKEDEGILCEKNDVILGLEQELNSVRSEASESLNRADSLSSELENSSEKIAALMSQVEGMLDEMKALRLEMDARSSELAEERAAKESLMGEYERQREVALAEESQRQRVLEEAKEKARELGVRMQVMESEYVEHLNLIQTLRTENGMLASQQTQINERLENAEKEASESKILLDQLQRETEILRRNEAPAKDEQARNDEKESCDHCDQCHTVVQALEAKLQERDAEIENLDNELANSIGNFVHMRESLRVSDLMNQSTSRSRNHEESRDSNDLAFQYNALMARNAELSDNLNYKIRENEELNEKIVSLEALNAALRERTVAVEDELTGSHDAPRVDPSSQEIRDNLQTCDNELKNARAEIEAMKNRHDEMLGGARSQIQQLELYNDELTRTCNDLTTSRSRAEAEITSLREEAASFQQRILQLQADVEKYKEENSKLVEVDSNKREPRAASSFFAEEKADAPKLFDAEKLFGPSPTSNANEQRELADLRNALTTKDLENAALSQQVKQLGEQIVALESIVRETSAQNSRELETALNNCQTLQTELAQVQQLLDERNRHIDSLNLELNNVGAQLAEQFGHRGNNGVIERLKAENTELVGKLEHLQIENARSGKTLDLIISIFNEIPREFGPEQLQALSYLNEVSPSINERLVEIKQYFDATLNERSELLTALDNCKQRISTLEEELKNSNDSTRIQELEQRVDQINRERDIKQLQVNDLTRSLEEMQESMEKASSNEEIRLRNLQASLDRALSENDQLKMQLETSLRMRETKGPGDNEKSQTVETLETSQVDQSTISDEAELRKAQSSEVEVPIVSESAWDEEAKMDDEMWSWNAEDARLAETHGHHFTGDTLLPSLERRLNAKIAELEDTIRDLETEKEKLTEEIKTTQVRSGKLVKKLKEFKIQNESLQQQLKIQKASVSFGDLDTAIEEELKLQINKLESALNEAKEETRRASLERDNLLKRIDVLGAANERLVEMKERQDMEVQVLQIRAKDLSNKLESMDWQSRESRDEYSEENRTPQAVQVQEQAETKLVEPLQSAAPPIKTADCLCEKYKAEIDELRDEIEALAAENEQLQKVLEEQKSTRLTGESRLNDRLNESAKEIEELSRRNSQIQKELDDTRNDHQSLMKLHDQEAKNSEQQITALKQIHDKLNFEIDQKTETSNLEITKMRDQLQSMSSEMEKLEETLRISTEEKNRLIERTKAHEETAERLASLEGSMTELSGLLNSRVQEVAELKREIQRLKADRKEALVTFEDLTLNHTREMSMKNEETHRYVLECESRLNEQNVEIAGLKDELAKVEHERSTCFGNVENMKQEIERLNNALVESRSHRESLQSELSGKEQELFREEDEVRKYALEVNRLNEVIGHLQKSSADTIEEANRRFSEIEDREASLKRTINELTSRESEAVAQLYREINEKNSQVASLQQTVVNLEQKIHEIVTTHSRETIAESKESSTDDSSSVNATRDEIEKLQIIVDELRHELSSKNEQIEDYKYQLSESTYPAIIQALQDQVNMLYDEKMKVEQTLEATLQELARERQAREESATQPRYQSRQLNSMMEDESEDNTRRFFEDPQNIRLRDAEDEIQALKMEIDERIERFKELHDRYENAEVEINDLRLQLASKEHEILKIHQKFENTSKECELLKNVLNKELPMSELESTRTGDTPSSNQAALERSSNELDIALYMLHQRDVRCEELTHELMQLLEERDTLQLRLSNAIRVNEELRRVLPNEARSSDPNHDIGDVEPIVEKPSPSKSVGPVEIAKEAIDTPNEEKIALAQNNSMEFPPKKLMKLDDRTWFPSTFVGPNNPSALENLEAVAKKLSQLHNTGHRRDVRLLDDRDMRHNQQMSLLAHRDVLNTLPPEAAARLVNANYTLSRDVQSQSSVLINWLWGKSTPKVVHM
ncbi:protein lava lamp-like isoform X2 [Venturia canescens]|nr:protein lava lamp-like isoform X2 [Venturia canescens]XP_043266652.1 protein lava lamp-like isoform X2 [Venturia canescens]